MLSQGTNVFRSPIGAVELMVKIDVVSRPPVFDNTYDANFTSGALLIPKPDVVFTFGQ